MDWTHKIDFTGQDCEFKSPSLAYSRYHFLPLSFFSGISGEAVTLFEFTYIVNTLDQFTEGKKIMLKAFMSLTQLLNVPLVL